jgi:hypothetical protein
MGGLHQSQDRRLVREVCGIDGDAKSWYRSAAVDGYLPNLTGHCVAMVLHRLGSLMPDSVIAKFV